MQQEKLEQCSNDQEPTLDIENTTEDSVQSSDINKQIELDENVHQEIKSLGISEYAKYLEQIRNEDILFLYQKQTKSNSIKTILHHFIDFMKSTGDEVVIESLSKIKDKSAPQIRKEFQSFMKFKKLNQQTFLAMFNSSRFSSHLKYYLTYYSLDNIIQSSVKESHGHVLCLIFFRRCFTQKQLASFIKTYKKCSSQF